MRWNNVLAALVVLAASLVASAALAGPTPVAPVSDAERTQTRAAIAAQLGPAHSYALVIGIDTFDSPGWHGLPGVGPEYDKVTAALVRQDFKIVGESQRGGRLDHAGLKAAIERFFQTYGARAENRLVVYIATHGYADPSLSQDGFLVPSDAGAPSGGSVPNGYSVRELSAALTSIAAQHVFMFFDSCFSGAMLPEPTRAASQALAGKPVLALSRETADWTLQLLAHNARLVLTAGNASQSVSDAAPFGDAVAEALSGAADADGDGLTLGTEIAQFVRGRVARASRLLGHANDPVFAVLPKRVAPPRPRPDLPGGEHIEYALQGDFIFLTPGGPKASAAAGVPEQQALLNDRLARLGGGKYLACLDCPTMVAVPASEPPLALASTEITYAQWDACFREMGCHRYLADDGFGRGDRPAANVTWLDALEYVTWLGTKPGADAPCLDYRLPTAAEWTEAALYGTAGPVTWPVAVADGYPVCWGCGAGEDGVAALRTASQPANAAGLYDMVGNLWEWVDDDAAACDLTAIRQAGQCAPGRVMGGSFATRVDALPAIGAGGLAPRTGNDRPWSSPTVGFRVACDVQARG
jgi:hypothetical protein